MEIKQFLTCVNVNSAVIIMSCKNRQGLGEGVGSVFIGGVVMAGDIASHPQCRSYMKSRLIAVHGRFFLETHS